ncbi:glycosyltransferase [Kitasatospora viridis]|uniref:Glycosyl transferase family 2 n=1 Tax=Kitasatospora viridis TaxID=281105 RepID=A0A561T6J4_9ACTN|nr:glycosyltransferase [Kitasatospora viridis]TWF82710.1 glycosyl transferase family 2 [Kitasatospora viridis]
MLLLRPPTNPAGVPPDLRRPPVDLEVVVPAKDEEGRLPATLEAVRGLLAARPWSSAVVVVDNDSVDGTLDICRDRAGARVPVHVIGCSEHGKGAAVHRGLATSTARYTGFLDADNATPVRHLDTAMDLLAQGWSAVIGSRLAEGAPRPARQSVLRQGGSWLFHRTAHHLLPDIADSQCGFKFFDGALVRAVLPRCRIDGFSFDVELLALIARGGGRIAEIPVDWTDVPGSTFSARRDGLRSMADLLRISLSR